jgi:hypothetical protein
VIFRLYRFEAKQKKSEAKQMRNKAKQVKLMGKCEAKLCEKTIWKRNKTL